MPSFRRVSHRFLALLILVSAPAVARSTAMDGLSAEINQWFSRGELAEADRVLSERLERDKSDSQARFALAVTRFLRAVERAAQTLHGLAPTTNRFGPLMMFVGIAAPHTDIESHKRVAYDDVRGLVERFVSDIVEVDRLLAELSPDEVELPLHIGRIRLDLNGDGKADDEENLYALFVALNPGMPADNDWAERFRIDFDRADAYWLRGYCNVLLGIGEAVLAHDLRDLFERTGHLLFTEIETPHDYLQATSQDPFLEPILDLIAAIHLVNLPVTDPDQLKSALGRFEEMIRQSRLMWAQIGRETDDKEEWIPSPRQTGVVPGVSFTDEMISGWHDFLNEAEQLLRGEKLVPFWRNAGGRGINLRRAFTESKRFDLVLWVQGSAATPFLERGTVTAQETWDRLNNIFRGEFVFFAFYLN